MIQDSRLASLTPEQKRLVADNLGLVGVHLKRRVADFGGPGSGREWEDLFQEGCLGLIRAAQTYHEHREIPFAAFALPRIHKAVRRALAMKSRPVPIGTHGRKALKAESRAGRGERRNTEKVDYALRDDRLGGERSRDRKAISRSQQRETVGERLRRKYERAVERASESLSQSPSVRHDRHALLNVLVHERFLIPDDEERRPLRRIARDTGSSYARVAQCDKRMADAIRTILEGDPEFRELQRRTRSNPAGTVAKIDGPFERYLADASADQFSRLYRNADPSARGRMLAALLDRSQEHLNHLIRGRFRSASSDERERIMDMARLATASAQ